MRSVVSCLCQLLGVVANVHAMKKTLLVLLFFFAFRAFGQTPPAYIDTLFHGTNGLENKLPHVGISIGILQDGKASYYAFGNLSHTSAQKIDSNTVFEIGSNTKLFTALLVAVQIAVGKIPETAYLDDYLPYKVELATGLNNKIRLTDLASCSSGLPTLSGDEYDDLLFAKDSVQPYKSVDKDYIYRVLQETTVIPDHGLYEYSNFNYALLGLVLENITGRKYAYLVRKDVLNHLGLRDTYTDSVPGENVAAGYYEGKPVDYLELDALKPAGVMRSNATDMLRFLGYQLHPPGGPMGTAIELTQKEFLRDSTLSTGLGWHILKDEARDPYHIMQGDTPGNSSLLFFDKKHNTGIVVLVNESNHNLTGIVLDYLLESMFREE